MPCDERTKLGFADALVSCPTTKWVPRQIVVLDWYDGPLSGVAELLEPRSEFYFDLLAERFNPTGLDERIYLLSELPTGSVSSVLAIVSAAEKPINVVWMPMWKFENDSEQRRADDALTAILEKRSMPSCAMYSKDGMTTFQGCWVFEGGEHSEDADWFSHFGV